MSVARKIASQLPLTMRFATSRRKPASLDAHGNPKWQHSCSRSTATCNQRFKKRIELRTHKQPIVAEHRGGTKTNTPKCKIAQCPSLQRIVMSCQVTHHTSLQCIVMSCQASRTPHFLAVYCHVLSSHTPPFSAVYFMSCKVSHHPSLPKSHP